VICAISNIFSSPHSRAHPGANPLSGTGQQVEACLPKRPFVHQTTGGPSGMRLSDMNGSSSSRP
jgi:hypothetical protein